MNGNLQHGEMQALQRVGILGGGAWGTALAQSARRAGRDVALWGPRIRNGFRDQFPSHQPRLPSRFALDPAIEATAKAKDLADADLVLLVVPSQFLARSPRSLRRISKLESRS